MKTLFIGQSRIELDSIDSTNSYASELLQKSSPIEGTLIYTFNQQNGRGQRGNAWLSEANKNVALSYILHPTFLQADAQFMLNKIVSLSVTDLMTEIIEKHSKTSDISIKWPNDIYIEGKKVAGILIENTLSGNTIKNTVIGIGININQVSFPAALNATSIKLVTNTNNDLTNCIERLNSFIEVRYLQLKAGDKERINKEYLQRLYQLNQWESYTSNKLTFEGLIIGISPIGKLKVQLRSEEIKEFNLQEISFDSKKE